MITSTLTVTDFVLARIAEDEAVARDAMVGGIDTDAEGRWEFVEAPYEGSWPHPVGKPLGPITTLNLEAWAVHATRHDPARVLAQCAAMRKIVEDWQYESKGRDTRPARTVAAGVLTVVIKNLASIWSDHPDWCEEWA